MPTDETAIKTACFQASVQIVLNIPTDKPVHANRLADVTVDLAWRMWKRWDEIDRGVTQPNVDPTP